MSGGRSSVTSTAMAESSGKLTALLRVNAILAQQLQRTRVHMFDG